MPTLLIRLEPENLDNADLDLRYLLPDQLAASTDGALTSEGYDYTSSDAMLLYLSATRSVSGPLLDTVVRFVETERVLGNDLRRAAVLATSEATTVQREGFTVVYGKHLLKADLFD
ncbi:MAG: hypothetical protein KIT31_02220 [Deltaproteobacteria bacterium]|nr:hypothetical protein [Deltaproteobacteria bacterium]